MFTLYRNTMFNTVMGTDIVEVMIGTYDECEAKAVSLRAKGFKTIIR